MIIIKLKNGIELKYRGKILLEIVNEYPNLLWVTADASLIPIGDENWSSVVWDNIVLSDIKSIKGVWPK